MEDKLVFLYVGERLGRDGISRIADGFKEKQLGALIVDGVIKDGRTFLWLLADFCKELKGREGLVLVNNMDLNSVEVRELALKCAEEISKLKFIFVVQMDLKGYDGDILGQIDQDETDTDIF